jgi:hypothetical protein
MTVFENNFGPFNFAVDNTIYYCIIRIILSQPCSKKDWSAFAAYRGWKLVLYIYRNIMSVEKKYQIPLNAKIYMIPLYLESTKFCLIFKRTFYYD